ncbi:unnamed protein product [Coregonus sp. 'balchen']|nr:unnamed protein product [Coregonus sp. 'balchen']
MVGRGFLGCFILFLSLASVCAIKGTVNLIKDIGDIEFGHTSPRHGLMLLHWLANKMNIDDNGNMRLNFDPTCINFYGNADNPRLLPFLPRQSGSYCSLGNLGHNNNYNHAKALPKYVTRRFYNPSV